MDSFTVLAEPTRRRILDQLVESACSVNELVDALGMSQPAVSKHLRVLREAGFVSSHAVAQQRIYTLEPKPFEDVARWLTPYHALWTKHLDSLESHLEKAR